MLYDILYNASERSTLPRLLLSSAAGHSGSETVLQCRLVFGVHLTDVFERWEFRSSYMRRVHLTLTSAFSLSFPLAHGHLLSATIEFDGLMANISTTKYGT